MAAGTSVPLSSGEILPAALPSHGENVPDGEADSISRIEAAILAQVAKQAAHDRTAHRDAHVKAHATVQARFQILDTLPAEYRYGIFARPADYAAIVRFSNGDGAVRSDIVPDGRGMAIKILGVDGSPSRTQDFLLINHPVFFVRNASDYVAFSTAKSPLSFFASLSHPRLHEGMIAGAIALQAPRSPLAYRYYSMTPFALGPHACKFAARPADDLEPRPLPFAHDFMRHAVALHLAEKPAVFDFLIQPRADPALPIEDPTIAWPENTAPFIPAARIFIPAQDFDTDDMRRFGENLSFTPWHAVPDHRPLGGINRVRRAIYEAISTYRHEFNHAERVEPAAPPPLRPPKPQTPETTMSIWSKGCIEAAIGGVIQENGWLTDVANAFVVGIACGSTRTRPHPWSTYRPMRESPVIDYPCWDGLFDRTYLSMHLRPAPPLADLPPIDKVAQLFARPAGPQRLSTKSTCVFPAFAQYLTDGFLRTVPTDTRMTTTNHEIDLCPLYGRLRSQTNALRLKSSDRGKRGRLKSSFRTINGRNEEFSPLLYTPDLQLSDPEFAALDTPLFKPNQPLGTPAVPPPLPPGWNPSREQLASLFAVGGDRVNASPLAGMINTILLREHNRFAGVLNDNHPDWDDEHVFQVTRNVIIAMFIKLVVEEYINHITPLPFNLKADPSLAWHANWNRPNRMTEEFSLLYRWHSLMPDQIIWPGGDAIPLSQFTLNNTRLLNIGLDAAFTAASAQPTAVLGAFNTEVSTLLPVEWLSIQQGRGNNLPSFNAYCAAFNHKPIESFADISSNTDIQDLLQDLYGTPDRVELYPGLFAEDRVPDATLPGLLMTMVAVDAFSQALTNPLLSEHVWGDPVTRDLTFTPEGFDLIGQTRTLHDILVRQGRPAGDPIVTMTQPTWRYADG